MSSTCTPILVGVASPVSEIKLAMVHKSGKFNRSELAQKIHASKD